MHSFEFIVRFVLGFIILLFVLKSTFVKKDYLVLLNQLDENLASRRFDQMLWSSSGE